MAGIVQNKIALVTGGSSGIGRATCLVFAREGAKVVIADIDLPGGEETVKMIKRVGGEATFIQTDVREAPQVEAMVDKIIKIYGRLDCAFNNAGVWGKHPETTHEHTEENWDYVINTDLKAVWLCMKYEIPQMLKQGKGTIVNTASALAYIAAFDGNPAYTAAKHGVAGLTKTAALEYAASGIRVNAICPGPTDTPLTECLKPKTEAEALESVRFTKQLIPIGRWAQPSEMAEPVVWLCSEASSFVTGLIMLVDGGYVIH
jgi:NAD(P)-dependent dehydrogenase (short-subunit alcohol dehydrogenase family)